MFNIRANFSFFSTSVQAIRIFIRYSDSGFYIDTSDAETIGDLKELIFKQNKIAVEQQRLLYSGKELVNNIKLSDLGVERLTLLYLLLTKEPKE